MAVADYGLKRGDDGGYNDAMSTISDLEIERDPAGFIHRVEAGESLLVPRDGRTVAEVKPVPAPVRQPRPFGLCAGEFTVPLDFDRPLSEVDGAASDNARS
jgi:antitoxin (DNA-binding transcriptional repressor) of toxin-antitoxin stability system